MSALFAVPGNLSTPTGGYVYARKLLEATRRIGFDLVHWPLPDGFPRADDAVLRETAARLVAGPRGWPILIDGLALGVLPPEVLDRISSDVVALCHHPLAHETGLTARDADALWRSECQALARTRCVVTTSATTAKTLVRDFGVRAEQISVALPGVARATPARGSQGPDVAILAVGALVPRKGHDTLIRALARLTHLHWHLSIVGSEDRDPMHAAALKHLIASRGLARRVRILGAASEEQLATLYDRADLFALASHYEGFGMVYAEAIAHGLPVVGTSGGAIPEATRGAAELVPPGDEDALTDALRRVLADPAYRQALKDRSCRAAPELPRWSQTAKTVAELLRTLSGGADGSAPTPRA